MSSSSPTGAWVANPSLRWTREGESALVEAPALGFRMRGPARLRELVERFEQPRPAETLAALEAEERALLLDHLLVVPVALADALGSGFLRPTATPVVRATDLPALRRERPALCLIGAPFDFAHAGARSPSGGPNAVRRALRGLGDAFRGDHPAELLDPELALRFRVDGAAMADLGDLAWRGDREGLSQVGARLRFAMSRLFELGGSLPVLIGGDHALTYHAVRAALDHHGRVQILQLDAHHDMVTAEPRQLNHATVMRELLELDGLVRLHQVGVRDLRPSRLDVHRPERVTHRSVRATRRGDAALALAPLDPAIPCYLTCDIDVLDPSVAPEVTNPRIGGLLPHELIDLVAAALERLPVIAVDVVEVCGPAGIENGAAACAARLIASTLAVRRGEREQT